MKVNINRFSSDFMFELAKDEWGSLRCSFSTIETGRGRYPKYLPFAFTVHGVAMLSSVLNSDKAIEVNISIVRAFVMIRHFAISYKELADKIAKLEKKNNKQFEDVYEALNMLLCDKEIQADFVSRERIGYKQVG